MPQQVYLISGCNRGLGLAFVKELVKQPEAVIFAGARSPSKATELQDLASKNSDRVHVVKLVAGDVETRSNKAVAEEIKTKYGRLDVAIANAAIGGSQLRVAEVSVDYIRELPQVNVIGPLVLFQSTFELLKASSSPKFVPITSGAGSASRADPTYPGIFGYGSTKASVNYLAASIHGENDWIVSFALAPGVVWTGMAISAKKLDTAGILSKYMENQAVLAEESTSKMLAIIAGATREKDGGKFLRYDGTEIPR